MSHDPRAHFRRKWTRHLDEHGERISLLRKGSDEDLVDLLGSGILDAGSYEGALVSTEILNRLARRQPDLPHGAVHTLRSAKGASLAGIEGQGPTRPAERILADDAALVIHDAANTATQIARDEGLRAEGRPVAEDLARRDVG